MTTIAAPKPVFPDVKPFPGQAENPRAVMGGNEPPLDERIVGELEEAISEDPGLRTRINELLAKGKILPDCADDDMAGRMGDFVKMCMTAINKVEGHHSTIKAPYLAATRAIDGRKRTYVDDLSDVKHSALNKIDAYRADLRKKQQAEAARIAEEQRVMREAEEQRQRLAQAAREVAEAEGRPAPAPEPEPMQFDEPPQRPAEPAPIARGDLGSRVGTKKVWNIKIESVRKLPNTVFAHPTVMEAINKVLAARVRGGERVIPGCTITEDEVVSVR